MLKIEHLTKIYGDKKAVDDLTLEIAAGEIAGAAEARQVVRDSFDVVRYNPDPTVHAGYMRHFERFKKVL